MSLDCLIDWIGLQGCGISAPASGFYINSMAGISLNTLEKLSKEESPTFITIWNDIQKRSVRRLQLEIQQRFRKKYALGNIVSNYDLERDYDATNTTAASAQYRGIFIDTDFFIADNNFKRSSLLSVWIQYLDFYSPIAGTVTIKVFDTITSTVIDTFSVTASIGWNTKQVNTSYSNRRIFIGVDSTSITSVYKYITPAETKIPVRLMGASMTIGANTSTLSLGNNSFGLGGIFGVRCSFDSIVCSNLDQFTLPLAYLEASELMQERMSSDRINKYTVDKEQAKELKAYYDSEFNRACDMACENIDLDLNDGCLECGSQLTIRNAPFYKKYVYEN